MNYDVALLGQPARLYLLVFAARHIVAFAIGLLSLPLQARELVISTISTRPEYHIARLQPIVDYAAARLREQGVSGGRVLLARDANQLQQYMAQGKVDWAGVTIASASDIWSSGAALPSLLAVDGRGRAYRSLYFVRHDSPLQSLAELRGRKLALRSFSSTSSYYVPLMQLRQLGLPYQYLANYQLVPSDDQVGILISGSETNSALWVLHDLADVGVANSLDWSDPNVFPATLTNQLKVIAESPTVPLGIELFSQQTPEPLRQSLSLVLLNAVSDAQGVQAMQSYSNTTQFENLSPQLLATIKQLSVEFQSIKNTANALKRRP